MTNLIEPLRRAALYRYLALSFMPPTAKRTDEIIELIPEMDSRLRDEALGLASERHVENLEGMYHLVIGAQKNVRCCETDFLQEAAGNKGAVLGDVAGFYRAFGFKADAELREVPDHIAIELSFLSFLAFKEGFALHRNDEDQVDTCRDAEAKFIGQHLDRWFHRFSGALAAMTRDGYYCSLALFADSALGNLLSEAREKIKDSHPFLVGHAPGDVLDGEEGCASCFQTHAEPQSADTRCETDSQTK